MLSPPGHSSRLKIIGQFSIPILTPLSRAKATVSGQSSSARVQFSSTLSFASPPRKVVTRFTPMSREHRMTLRIWSKAASRVAASGWSGFG